MPATIKPFLGLPERLGNVRSGAGQRTGAPLSRLGPAQANVLPGRGERLPGLTTARSLPGGGDATGLGIDIGGADLGGLSQLGRDGLIEGLGQNGEEGDAGESLFQIEIPEELRRQAEEGIGREAGRAQFTLGGSEIAAQAGRTQRELRGQPFLQGASASGFAQQRIRQVTMQKNKALQRLAIGIESRSEQVRRRALDELKAVEFQNEQLKRDFENMRERERLQAEARRQRFLLAERQFRANRPRPWFEQAANIGLNVAASQVTGGITAGGGP